MDSVYNEKRRYGIQEKSFGMVYRQIQPVSSNAYTYSV
jgi:hypothetical protein